MDAKNTALFVILLLTVSLPTSGCGLLGMFGGGEEALPAEEGQAGQPAPAAVAPAETGGVATKREFFTLRKDIATIRSEMARLKSQIENFNLQPQKVYTEEPEYGFADKTEITHKVTLNNGTEVLGKLIRQNLDEIVITTRIGTLNILRRHIKDISPAEAQHADCIILGEVGAIEQRVYPDRRMYSGFVKNKGERRADFVLVKVKLAAQSTRIVAVDSAYVDGSQHIFNSGVITDTSIEPDGTSPFTLTVYLPPDAEVAYFTAEVSWKEYE